ncbi:MAG TPA: tyrosine-type recombinase/integrase [Myxococcaceae bacterium]|nr:tyrosine-type recombinase/integrase [Myxococcaceae bacterium]
MAADQSRSAGTIHARLDPSTGLHIVAGIDGKPIAGCAKFLERLTVRGLSPRTVEAYAYDLALVHRWLLVANLQIEQLNVDHVYQFLAWERGRESQPKSINRRLHTLRRYYGFVTSKQLAEGIEDRSDTRRSRRDYEMGIQRVRCAPTRQLRVKEARTLVEPLSLAQVQDLLSSLRRYRDLCIAHAMLLCGLRTQEVLSLRFLDLDFTDRRIRVIGKGNKERLVPLPTLLVQLLQRYFKLERPASCASDHVFVVLQGKRRGLPMGRAALRKVFRTQRQRKSLSNANPHRLRHTFGTDMARSGVRLPILQRMMGHVR